jgi:hypothetical protein
MSCPRSTPQYQSRRVDDEPRLLREMRALARRRPRVGADHFYDYVCTGQPRADRHPALNRVPWCCWELMLCCWRLYYTGTGVAECRRQAIFQHGLAGPSLSILNSSTEKEVPR